MKKQAIQEALTKAVALSLGSAGSRVVADKLPVSNVHLKRGGIVLLGVLGGAFLDRKTKGKAFVQDVALSAAATQVGSWVKDALGDKVSSSPLLTTALGSPSGSYNDPIQMRMGYANFNQSPQTFDTSYEDVSDVKFTM